MEASPMETWIETSKDEWIGENRVARYDEVFVGRVVRLVRSECQGKIKVGQLTSRYLDLFQQVVDVKQMGFDSDLKLCCRLSRTNSCLSLKNLSDSGREYYLLLEERFYLQWLEEAVSAGRFSLVEEAIGRHIPDDVVSIKNLADCKMGDIFDEIFEGQSMRVFLVNVISVNRMYLHLLKYREAFKLLRNAMRVYNYEDDDDVFSIPCEFLALLLPVAAKNPFDNYQWNRCLVLEYPSLSADDDSVAVFSLDFANEFRTDRKELRYLKKEHMHLPPQAVPVSLFGIESSSESDWKHVERLLYHRYVKHRYWIYCFFARVVGNTCKVRLCDFTSRHKLHFDQLLVDHGLAKFFRERFEIYYLQNELLSEIENLI